MPPKVRFERDTILQAALELVRQKGIGALNARAVADALGCSTQPLFREFRSMEEIRTAVIQLALQRYNQSIAQSFRQAEKPYLASGLAYIRFAREEPELFRLLFMCERRGELSIHEDVHADEILGMVAKATGLDRERAEAFHLKMWIFVHGLAVMIVTKFVELDDGQAEQLLRETFLELRAGEKGNLR